MKLCSVTVIANIKWRKKSEDEETGDMLVKSRKGQ